MKVGSHRIRVPANTPKNGFVPDDGRTLLPEPVVIPGPHRDRGPSARRPAGSKTADEQHSRAAQPEEGAALSGGDGGRGTGSEVATVK